MLTLEIGLSREELEQRRRRMRERNYFEEPDRVPVLPGIATRYWLPLQGLTFREYFGDPRVMMEAQLKAAKWWLENIRDDRSEITLHPDFQNILWPSGLGAEIIYKDGFPWVKEPIIKEEKDLDGLRKVDPVKTGFLGRRIKFYSVMKKMAEKVRIRFSDGSKLKPQVVLPVAAQGPFTQLGWLRGSTQLYIDIKRRPEFVHAMMEVTTEKTIEYNEEVRRITGTPKNCGIGFGDDLSCYLSPDLYRRFVLPYHHKLYDHYGTKARGLHLCGKIDHLLKLLVEEEKLDALNGFGYETDVQKLAETMGGRVRMGGGPSPMLFLQGPQEKILDACKHYIKTLAPLGGYLLQDGYNICPGTPVTHINLMMKAAEEYGMYPST